MSGRAPWWRLGRRTKDPGLQLTRDAIEAEETALRWLHARGFTDAWRIDPTTPLGIRGHGLRAYVSFDALPMEQEVLARIADSVHTDERPVSFAFAGWTPAAREWADLHGIPLVRFTFAGTTDPTNESARRLRRL